MIDDFETKQRVMFNIGYTCNNNCRFCAIAKTREMVSDLTTEEIKNKIRKAHERGVTELIFSGGEGSIRPDFVEIISFARDQGFGHIEVTTNGRLFGYRSFAESAVAAGLHYIRFSLHGHVPEIHDYLTRVPGSYKELLIGIRNLVNIGNDWDRFSNEPLYLEVTTAVVEQNYRSLVQLIQLTSGLGINQNNLNFVIPWGSAWIHQKKIMPRISDAAAKIREAINFDKKNSGIIKKVANIPFCLLQGYEEYISEVREGKVDIMNPVGKPFDYQNHRKSKKVLFAGCENCSKFKLCEGIYPEYISIYGSEEFSPIE